MNTCWSHSPSNKEILKPQSQTFTSSCKSFVLSISFPPFVLLHDLYDVPAPPAVVVLLYLVLGIFAFMLLWGVLPLGGRRRKGEENSFHSSSQSASEVQFLLICPLSL